MGLVAFAMVAGLVFFVGRWLADEVRQTQDVHALAGLLGESEREAVLARLAARVVDRAESCLRLQEFGDALRSRAWSGTPLSVERESSRWSVWSFADGREFRVALGRRNRIPRHMRRIIVSDVSSTPDGVSVAAYAPVAGPSLTLDVTDVRAPV